MSKNVAIQEGGIARTLSNVKKIAVDLQDGGTAILVPEDEYDGITKYISANGTYEAAYEGHYAYTEVEVSIPGSAGNIPGGAGCSIVGLDSDGDDWVVSVGDDGELEDTRPPVRIQVLVPPDKTSYRDGEAVDLTGIMVMAYDADGHAVYAIQEHELSVTPEVVDTDIVEADVYTNGNGVTARRITYSKQECRYRNAWWDPEHVVESWCFPEYLASGAGDIKGYTFGSRTSGSHEDNFAELLVTRFYDREHDRWGVHALRLSGNNYRFDVLGYGYRYTDADTYYIGWTLVGSSSYSTSTEEWSNGYWGKYDWNLPISYVDPRETNPDEMYPFKIYATVGWARPGDGRVLYDRFEITLIQPGGGGGSFSGGGGDGFGGDTGAGSGGAF